MTIHLPDPLYAEIAHVAKVRKVSKSEIVRERLANPQLAATESAGSLWSRMEDLVIAEDHLPRDLSSNPKHLANYGKPRAR